mmetsp:Transcript_15900/g.45715  ORF Transcript_15900/g.45715 Transcript_15900/m.45715 type:complete len:215 (+) Transcript_15900:2-646(+)
MTKRTGGGVISTCWCRRRYVSGETSDKYERDMRTYIHDAAKRCAGCTRQLPAARSPRIRAAPQDAANSNTCNVCIRRCGRGGRGRGNLDNGHRHAHQQRVTVRLNAGLPARRLSAFLRERTTVPSQRNNPAIRPAIPAPTANSDRPSRVRWDASSVAGPTIPCVPSSPTFPAYRPTGEVWRPPTCTGEVWPIRRREGSTRCPMLPADIGALLLC